MGKKYCVVPQCFNSTVKTPDKLFFCVPRDPKSREKWMRAIRRVDSLGPKSVGFCCEDHFDVENDMENYVKHKLVGGLLKLKKDVLPHKFLCQNRIIDKPKSSVASTSHEELDTRFDEISLTSKNSLSDNDRNEIDVTESESDVEEDSFKTYMQRAALLCISREPQMLLGLPKQWYSCIQLLSESCKCSTRDVMIVLKKTRLYQCNAILALDFGITSSVVEIVLKKYLPLVSSCMKSLVFFPNPDQVLANIPMPFRKRYSNVKSIIDCLEIQIEKPTNAVTQALTWSENKSCNTIKYLISITPDGIINFISEGYGGRASVSEIFEDCGILDLLPKKGEVMADRGFKNETHILQQKVPASVSAKVTTTKSEVLETKRISEFRIHVERTIGRLRNFGFLMPHATVDFKQIGLLDYVMITACGIVNLQNARFNFKN